MTADRTEILELVRADLLILVAIELLEHRARVRQHIRESVLEHGVRDLHTLAILAVGLVETLLLLGQNAACGRKARESARQLA